MRNESNFGFNEDACFRLLDLGYYKDAIILGQKLITENPKSYDAHHCLAIGYYEVGNFRKSLEHAKKMEELASSEEELALAYNRLGLAYDNLGYIDLAMMYHSKALTLGKKLKDDEIQALAINSLAGIYESKGDYKKALEFYKRSLKLEDDPDKRAPILNNIGILYGKLGNYTKAIKYLKEALDISERIGNYQSVGQYMLNLGNGYRKMGRYEEAEKFLKEGLRRMQVVGNKYWEFFGYEYLGYYYLDKKEYDKALESFYMAFSIAVQEDYNEKYWMLVYMAIVLKLKPRLKAYLMELSGGDQALMEEIKRVRKTEGFKIEFAKYQKPQKQKTSKGKQEG